MEEEQKEKILGFYDEHIKEFGFGAQAVGWGSRDSQVVRFEALCDIGDLNNKTILDVGCGFGYFYEYLNSKYKNIKYTGVDINKRYIDIAKEKYPDASFVLSEFGDYKGGPFDHVFASGALTFKIQNYKDIYFSYIKKMYEMTNIGMAFNVLNKEKDDDDEDEIYALYLPKEIKDLCMKFSNNVHLRDDYLEDDLAVYLKK